MAHLYPHLRLHQVFGANTDVGKTIFTTALCLASSVLPVSSAAGNHEEDVRRALCGDGGTSGERVHYLKPVSTGPMTDADDGHIGKFAAPQTQHTLLRYPDAVSPHLAARLATPSHSPLSDLNRTPSDAELVRAIGQWLSGKAQTTSSSSKGVAFVETAGGPHSPGPLGTSQVHLLRPLRLPTILVGDSQLGGISTTRSAYESLLMAGHDVSAILLFSEGSQDKWGNADYLVQWGREVGVPVWGLAGLTDAKAGLWGGPPSRASSSAEDEQNMHSFYRGLVYGRKRLEEDPTQSHGVVDVVSQLRAQHQQRLADLASMPERTMQSCWWPTTQHALAKSSKDVTVIDSAHGDFFSTSQQAADDEATSRLNPMLDGSASWWTQCLGHSHPRLTQAAAQAAGRYGHVLFPMASNEPALKLSEGLLGRLPEQIQSTESLLDSHFPAPGRGWADRVFFSDDGSTGMEVALKMAVASAQRRYAAHSGSAKVAAGRKAGTQAGRPDREWKILGLKGSYHGDTIGAMDASEPSVYSNMVSWYRGRGEWMEPPQVGIVNGMASVTIPDKESSPEWDRQAQNCDKTSSFDSLQHIYDVTRRLQHDPLASTYRHVITAWLDRIVRLEGSRFGALLLEPLVLGAAGMVFVDPLFQRILVDVVRESEDLFSMSDPPMDDARRVRAHAADEWQGLPVVFDEVFTGLYRLGHMTPSSVLGVSPDISCLAKILTGGLVPMSVTLASKAIYDTFVSPEGKKEEALLHGHSYTAHPVGCEVARETLRTLSSMERDESGDWASMKSQWQQHSGGRGHSANSSEAVAVTQDKNVPQLWSFWSPEVVHRLSRDYDIVAESMTLGTVLVVKLRDPRSADGGGGYSSTAALSLVTRLRTGLADRQRAGMDHPTEPTDSGQGQIPSAAFAAGEAGTNLPFNIHTRPLGNVLYIMCSLNTSAAVRGWVERILLEELKREEAAVTTA